MVGMVVVPSQVSVRLLAWLLKAFCPTVSTPSPRVTLESSWEFSKAYSPIVLTEPGM